MSAICMLDEATANRIAAGEVVERPASVAKELVENAVDAGATAITIEIRDGGITYLRVTDNGCGMEESDCKLAFERHATSKIRSGDSLTAIQTLGFRGEALPSIASVAKVELTTRVKDADFGTKLCIEAGRITDVRSAGSPTGTTFVVKDLFFNTPARRKFLKKPAIEGGYVADVAAELALCRPDIAIRFINNGKTIYQTPGTGDLQSVIYKIHGKETAMELVPVKGSIGAIRIEGLVGVGNCARATRAYEYFFLNGRYIRSAVLSNALEKACAEKVMIGRFPYCVLRIDVPLESVDINVHPSKLEVRFKDDFPIRENMTQILESAFPQERMPSAKFIEPAVEQLRLAPQPVTASAPMPISSTAPRAVFPQPIVAKPAVVKEEERVDPKLMVGIRTAFEPKNKPEKAAIVPPNAAQIPAPPQAVPSSIPTPAMPVQEETAPPPAPELPTPVIIGQLFDTYMLLQYDQEMLIVDQHAAHERILYERFKKALGQESLAQPMLVPYVFEVSPREEAMLLEQLDNLKALGFSVEAFGPRSFRVLEVPYLLGQPQVADFVKELVEKLDEFGAMRELDLKRDTLVRMACHKAVKGGDPLTFSELTELLNTIYGEQIPLTCPHGRPILMKITKHELERKFKRIQ